MASPRHVILSSFGTDGDVFPFIGLGKALRRRGHRVTVVTIENYRALALESDLEFRTLNTVEEAHQALAHPDFWHPLKGPAIGARWGVGYIPRQYELFMELAQDANCLFVASPAIFGPILAAEKLGRPLISVVLQPWMIRSNIAPPVLPAGLSLPPRLPNPIGDSYWWMINTVGYFLVGRQLNRFRRTIDLPPVGRVFDWWLSKRLILGMFPPQYGPPQADWAPQIRLSGFPLSDGHTQPLQQDIVDFCRAGDPPIVFTFGTGMRHGAHLFAAAMEAVQQLGARALFLTRHRQQLPANLPSSIRCADFAPFGELFPHCSAVVHHGGVGTIAKALAAGIPQLILPIAYDQKDNALRVKRLGCGDWLSSRRRSASRIAQALDRILSPACRAAARSHQGAFAQPGLETAADLVESQMR